MLPQPGPGRIGSNGCLVFLPSTQVRIISKWTSWPVDVKDWCQHSSMWMSSWSRERWHLVHLNIDGDLLCAVGYHSKHSLLFEWILRREISVSGIGGQTVAYEVNNCVLTLSRSVSVMMRALLTSWKVPAMLLVGPEISWLMIVLWAKSTTLAHIIGSEDVTAPNSLNRIESTSKFIVSANKR